MSVNFLAELWGICIVVVSFALLVRESHLKKLYASIESEQGLFLWGVISLVIGVSMVLTYNVWVWQWQLIITILGWISLIKGLALLLMPESVKKYTKKMETSQYVPYALVIAVIIGLVITYFGFTA